MVYSNEKLILQKEMKGTKLIQRLHKPYQFEINEQKVDNPFSFGGGLVNGGLSLEAMTIFRKICSFDYMGSTEFEWGAVPAAFTFLVEQAIGEKVVNFSIDFHEKKDIINIVYVICPKSYRNEVEKRIKLLYQNPSKVDLKEYCGLREYFFGRRWKEDKGPSENDKENIGWLELDNGFMFFTDKEMYNKFCEIFELKGI